MAIARRDLLKGVVQLPLAAVLADPLIARAVAAGLGRAMTTTASGKTTSGALALPAKTPAPAILLVHEWWGLNDQIKSVAAALARQGYMALALDLFDGRVAVSPEEAKVYSGQAIRNAGTSREICAAWVAWLRGDKRSTGKVASIGWCFGGGWSLNAALLAPEDAAVIYYGNVGPEYGGVSRAPAALKRLAGPVLGHFAARDRYIDRAMVGGFEQRMKAAGKGDTLLVHWYDADHAFANPTGARYDARDAQLAWSRTLEFLRKTL